MDGDQENEELKTALDSAKRKTVHAELAVNTATQAIEAAKDEKTKAVDTHHAAKDTHDATDFKVKEKEL